MQTKSYDEFNPLDDVWHGVVGEPGGILVTTCQTAILVVGSARAGDADDEDPPPISGPILLGWHGVLDAPDGPTDMGEQRSRQRRRARPHGLDVPTTCRPGPSFQHDNGGNKITQKKA